MEIPIGVEIAITGEKGGTLTITIDGERIWHAEGINFNRASHWNPEENKDDVGFAVEVLNAIAECTNYVGVSDEKLDKQ